MVNECHTSAPDNPNTLRPSLFGTILIRFEMVSSTNDVALRLAGRGLPEGAVVLAKTQRRGRGRHGREWFSPTGGMFFSIVLRPKALISLLPIAAGVSTARAIRRLFHLEATLKWPNDVTVKGRKIAGILAESSTATGPSYAVVGFGVNANNMCASMPPNLREHVTSILDHVKSKVDIEWLMKEILDEFAAIYSQVRIGNHVSVVREWKKLTNMLGQRIIVHDGENLFEAIALDLDFEGALLVQTENGAVRRLLSGDVSLHRAK